MRLVNYRWLGVSIRYEGMVVRLRVSAQSLFQALNVKVLKFFEVPVIHWDGASGADRPGDTEQEEKKGRHVATTKDQP